MIKIQPISLLKLFLLYSKFYSIIHLASTHLLRKKRCIMLKEENGDFHFQSLLWYVGLDVEIVLQKQGATIGSMTIQILKKNMKKLKISGKILRSGICGSFFSCSHTLIHSLSSGHEKVIKWHLFCSRRWKIIIWVKYDNPCTQKIVVFTLKSWQVESERTRGKRNHKFRALAVCCLLCWTGLLAVWTEQHASYYTWFLPRPARKDLNVPKLKSG